MTTPIPNPLPAHKDREKLILTRDQACELIDGDNDDFETISNEVCDTSRCSIHYHLIIRRKSDNRFFADGYSVGATESQDESPWEYTDPDFSEVYPREKTVVEYV